MKRSVVVLALFLGLAASLTAQVQGGTIGGTVQDEQGAVLPGVTVILQGSRLAASNSARNISWAPLIRAVQR
jgi:hypothetical protein